jgi:hypothetical protein
MNRNGAVMFTSIAYAYSACGEIRETVERVRRVVDQDVHRRKWVIVC